MPSPVPKPAITYSPSPKIDPNPTPWSGFQLPTTTTAPLTYPPLPSTDPENGTMEEEETAMDPELTGPGAPTSQELEVESSTSSTSREGKRVIFFQRDEASVARSEFIDRSMRESAAQQQEAIEANTPIPSASEILKKKRQHLLQHMTNRPLLKTQLKLTPAKVMKMNLEEIDNHLESFKAASSFETTTELMKLGVRFTCEVVEELGTMNYNFNEKIPLSGYAENVYTDEMLGPVCDELALEYADDLSEYLTPEVKLGYILLNNAVKTVVHNKHISVYNKHNPQLNAWGDDDDDFGSDEEELDE